MSSLKEQNKTQLTILLIISLLPVYISLMVLHGAGVNKFFGDNIVSMLSAFAGLGLTPLLVMFVVLNILVDLVDNKWKERLAHFRWNNPLPGTRVDKLIRREPRIDIGLVPKEIENILNSNLSANERNSYWYKNIYLKVRDLPAVSNTHKQYLLYRDASSGVFILLLLSSLADILLRYIYSFQLLAGVGYLLGVVYLALIIFAANSRGNRFVANTVANFCESKR